MKILRTPDDRFLNLPDYDFTPHYVELGEGLRLHYVDEGPRDGRTILLMHGEPSWSYLYRFMIRALSAAGFRVLAPDVIRLGHGFFQPLSRPIPPWTVLRIICKLGRF